MRSLVLSLCFITSCATPVIELDGGGGAGGGATSDDGGSTGGGVAGGMSGGDAGGVAAGGVAAGGVAAGGAAGGTTVLAPTSLTYTNELTCRVGTACRSDTPSVDGGAPTSFTVTPALPTGLAISATTGVVEGTPTVGLRRSAFTVTARNAGGTASTSLFITVLQRVSTCAELQAIPAGSTAAIVLANDLDCAGIDFRPLENFRGSIDGSGFVIRNLRIAQRGLSEVGLIGRGEDVRIENLGVVGASVTAIGARQTGILAGRLHGHLRRVFTSGVVTSTNYTGSSANFSGGLIGYAQGEPTIIEDAFSRAVVQGGNDYTGGLVGAMEAGDPHSVRRTYAATASVSATALGQGSGRSAALLTYSWSEVKDSFGVAQPGVPFALDVFGTATNNIGAVSNSTAADAGVTSLQGTGLSSRAPFQSWDFAQVWEETPGFPLLRGFSPPARWDATLHLTPAYQSLRPGTAITPMVPTLTNAGTLTSCTISPALAAGLSLDSATCVISGTPTSATPTTMHRVQAVTSTGTLETTVVLLVAPPSRFTWPAGPFSFDVTAGAIAPLTPTLEGGLPTDCQASPALPPGLVLNPVTCVLSGTPTERAASTPYLITASNEAGAVVASLTFTVVDPRPTLTYLPTMTLTVGVPLVPIEAVTRFNVVSVLVSPALPAGLSLTAGGVIEGTPSATAPATTYTVTAGNAVGSSTSTFSLSVVAPGTVTVSPQTASADSTGRLVVAAVMSNRLLVVQRLDAAGGPVGAPVLALQAVGQLEGPYLASARGTGAFVVASRYRNPANSHFWVARSFDPQGQARSGIVVRPTHDSWGEVAIDDAGRFALVSSERLNSATLPRLSLFSETGSAVTLADPGGCVSQSHGLHVAVAPNGRGVMTCQGHQSDPVSFRRFDTTTGGLDLTWRDVVPSRGSSSWYDSHLVGINDNGAFVIAWAASTARRVKATVFDAMGAEVATHQFAENPATVQFHDTTRAVNARLPIAGDDFIVPYRDPANGTAGFFNSYARISPAGVLKGTAPGAMHDLATLIIAGTATPWVRSGTMLVRDPFVLVP